MPDSNASKAEAACPSCGIDLAISRKQHSGLELGTIPDIQKLLNSNDEPPPSVQDELLSRRTKRELRIAEITSIVGTLESTPAELKEEQRALEQEQEISKVILHPIRRVPSDVWLYIFDMNTRLDLWRVDRSSNVCFESWTLSHVCSQWRQAVLSSSRLWAPVQLSLDYGIAFLSIIGPPGSRSLHKGKDGNRALESSIFFLNQQLQRSRDYPLTLSLRIPSNFHFRDLSRALLLNITAHSQRWREVSITHTVKNARDFDALSQIRGALSSLRTLHLHYDSYLESGRTIDTFQYAPQLQELRLRCRTSFVDDFLFPWSQILHLHYTMHDCQMALALLAKMPNLVSCKLSILSFIAELHLQNGLLPLGSLTTLILDNWNSTCKGLHQLLEHISAPFLDNLHIRSRRTDLSDVNEVLVDPLSHFFQRSNCTLRSCSLILNWKSVLVVSILRILPSSLTKLRLYLSSPQTKTHSDYSGTIVLEALHHYPVDSPAILPLLQDLDIHSSQITSDVLDVIESRQQQSPSSGIAPLKRVILVGCSDATSLSADPRSIALQENGIDLRFFD
ncbi:hypothetical protein BT96DRAFT_1024082 [Gymnopus androsaceus JB14]|uniref:F-box domain-containing protein n=1 Tax=Gymnopus androsaceus JB14 TaxID=1447944 RepID=A0A6A4H114_9AGAR|nr:hypothetical protein BT96DRAFT_1024082 [Gymnopus androsaceus JB14]